MGFGCGAYSSAPRPTRGFDRTRIPGYRLSKSHNLGSNGVIFWRSRSRDNMGNNMSLPHYIRRQIQGKVLGNTVLQKPLFIRFFLLLLIKLASAFFLIAELSSGSMALATLRWRFFKNRGFRCRIDFSQFWWYGSICKSIQKGRG